MISIITTIIDLVKNYHYNSLYFMHQGFVGIMAGSMTNTFSVIWFILSNKFCMPFLPSFTDKALSHVCDVLSNVLWKNSQFHLEMRVEGFFFMTRKSISKGFVFKLYSFSKTRLSRYSRSSRFIAATKPGCRCIFVSSIRLSFWVHYSINCCFWLF